MITSTALASPPTCPEVLSACDQALTQEEKALDLSNLALKDTQKVLEDTRVQRDDAQAKLGSLFRNPYFLIGIGLVGGVILTKH